MELGTKGVQYASRVIMQTAINGGGGLMNTLRKSYSVGDVTDGRINGQRSGGVILQELEGSENIGGHQHQRRLPLSPLQDVSDSEFEEIGEELDGKISRRNVKLAGIFPYFLFVFFRSADETAGTAGPQVPDRHPRGLLYRN